MGPSRSSPCSCHAGRHPCDRSPPRNKPDSDQHARPNITHPVSAGFASSSPCPGYVAAPRSSGTKQRRQQGCCDARPAAVCESRQPGLPQRLRARKHRTSSTQQAGQARAGEPNKGIRENSRQPSSLFNHNRPDQPDLIDLALPKRPVPNQKK